MKFLVGLLCVLVLFVSVAPVEAGGQCNVQALQAFAGGHAVVQAQVFAQPVQQVVAQPVFAAPVYSSAVVQAPVFASAGHCAVQAFAAPVVQVQQVRAARVRNQVVKSKAKSRVR